MEQTTQLCLMLEGVGVKEEKGERGSESIVDVSLEELTQAELETWGKILDRRLKMLNGKTGCMVLAEKLLVVRIARAAGREH